MKNEKLCSLNLKVSEAREVQRALLYHIDSVMIPYYEKIARERDYYPTEDLGKRIEILQKVLSEINSKIGIFTGDD